MSSPTLSEFIVTATRQLAEAGLPEATLDVRWLVGHALGLDRTQVFNEGHRELCAKEVAEAAVLIDRRAQREPVARILGQREFWGMTFGLNEATLEPRPDSEALIEVALASGLTNPQSRILDVGTGTGCLLLSLLEAWKEATGLGLDIAPRAIEQARLNATHLGLSSRASFKVNNWLENLSEKFDLIISNPPYIASGEIDGLMPEVRDHDPRLALDGGPDGLDVYRLLALQMSDHLKSGGRIVLEVGHDQASQVADLLDTRGFADITIHPDLAGNQRCIAAHMP